MQNSYMNLQNYYTFQMLFILKNVNMLKLRWKICRLLYFIKPTAVIEIKIGNK